MLPALVAGVSWAALGGDLFEYGRGENVAFEHVFDNAESWSLNRTVVADGELKAVPGQQWTSAWRVFPLLDLHYGDITIYWRFRSVPSSGEHGKLYLNLNLTTDPYQMEQRKICLNIRPGTQHIFYIDPGYFAFPHHSEMLLAQAAGMFGDASMCESFRLVIRKTGPDTAVVAPYYWDRNLGTWLIYRTWSADRSRPAPPMIASIADNMQGQSYVEMLSFGLFSDIPAVKACAVTQIPRFPEEQMKRQAAEVQLLKAMDYWRADSIVLDDRSSAILQMTRSNTTPWPVQETLQWSIDERTAWRISPKRIATKLMPGEQRKVEFAVTLAGDIGNAFPLPRLESRLELTDRAVKRSRAMRIDLKASFAEPLVGTCALVKAKPNLDGNLDDPAWQQCKTLSAFIGRDPEREIGHPAACIPAIHPTEARLAYDKQNLYMSFRCHEPELPGLVTKIAERDGYIWQDDSVELWLDINLDKDTYFHFAINANAVIFDEEKKPGPIQDNLDNRWDSHCVVKAGREPGAWTLEAALPWQSIGIRAPEPGTKIGLEVQRNRKQGPEEMSQWSPTFSGWGHVPQRFGVLALE